MADRDPGWFMDRAADGIERHGSLSAYIRVAGFGGLASAVIYVLINGITGLAALPMAIISALSDGISGLIGSTFGGAIDMIGAGAQAGVESAQSGLTGMLGPFAFPFMIGVVFIGLYVASIGWDRMSFSPFGWIRRVF